MSMRKILGGAAAAALLFTVPATSAMAGSFPKKMKNTGGYKEGDTFMKYGMIFTVMAVVGSTIYVVSKSTSR